MVDVVRSDGLIEIRTRRLSCALHLATLTMEVADLEGRTALSGFLPRVVTQSGILLAQQSTADGYGEIRSRGGTVTRVQARARLESGLELALALDFADAWNGVILDLAVENRGEQTHRIVSIDPCWWSARAGGRLALPHEPGATWFFRLGFASDSHAGYVPLERRGGGREPDPSPGPLTPAEESAQRVSDCVTALCAPDRGGLTLGFVTHERFLSHVSVRSRSAQITELLASVPLESRELAPAGSLRAERLWIAADPPGSDGVAGWAEQTAREMAVVPRPGATVAWSSRHSALRERGIFAVREALAANYDLDAGIELLEIEEGYEPELGDWLAASDGFPEGVEGACREIEKAGFQAGVWLTPFLASLDSQLLREHPDWRLLEADGSPAPTLELPGRSAACARLDPSHPELREWLAELARRLYGAGCRRLRLDWLAEATRPGPRRSGETCVEAYRGALRAMREAAPQTPWLVASRAPLGPSIGLVDAIRTGPALASAWSTSHSWFRRAEPLAGAADAVRNAMARASLAPLWKSDPDCLLLRDSDNPLSQIELETVACVALAAGGLISFSGWIRDFGSDRCALLRRLVPALERMPEPGSPIRGPHVQLVSRFPDASALLLLPNLEARATSFSVDFGQLGLRGPHHIWDARGQRSLGVHSERWESERVPPHGVLLLRFTPADGRARVIGSTLHLSSGALELSRLRAEPPGTLALRLRQPGQHSGYVSLAAEPAPLAVHVGFSDQIELRVSSLEVENPSRLPGTSP